jgi:hypothetical protein
MGKGLSSLVGRPFLVGGAEAFRGAGAARFLPATEAVAACKGACRAAEEEPGAGAGERTEGEFKAPCLGAGSSAMLRELPPLLVVAVLRGKGDDVKRIGGPRGDAAATITAGEGEGRDAVSTCAG